MAVDEQSYGRVFSRFTEACIKKYRLQEEMQDLVLQSSSHREVEGIGHELWSRRLKNIREEKQRAAQEAEETVGILSTELANAIMVLHDLSTSKVEQVAKKTATESVDSLFSDPALKERFSLCSSTELDSKLSPILSRLSALETENEWLRKETTSANVKREQQLLLQTTMLNNMKDKIASELNASKSDVQSLLEQTVMIRQTQAIFESKQRQASAESKALDVKIQTIQSLHSESRCEEKFEKLLNSLGLRIEKLEKLAADESHQRREHATRLQVSTLQRSLADYQSLALGALNDLDDRVTSLESNVAAQKHETSEITNLKDVVSEMQERNSLQSARINSLRDDVNVRGQDVAARWERLQALNNANSSAIQNLDDRLTSYSSDDLLRRIFAYLGTLNQPLPSLINEVNAVSEAMADLKLNQMQTVRRVDELQNHCATISREVRGLNS